jgi:2-keto-4-pentenoate hydratase
MAESLSQYIEQLSDLPPRARLEEFRAIPDAAVRRQVAECLPPNVHGEMLAESMLENLNRNVLKDVARRNPSQAA